MNNNNDKPKSIKINREGAELVLSFPYDWDFISALKHVIHPRDRSWDPKNKIWRVKIEREADVIDLAKRLFVGAFYEYHDEDNALVTENLKTGEKTVIESLFK